MQASLSTLASLSTPHTQVHEAFSWGAGGAGQLGHGSFADELLPHPIQALQSAMQCNVLVVR